MNEKDIKTEKRYFPAILMGRKYPMGLLLLLGGASVMLCLVPPLFIMAAFPLTLAFLLYGRRKGGILGTLCFGLIILFIWKFQLSVNTLAIFIVVFLMSAFTSEMIFRKKDPIVGYVGTGAFLVAVVGLLFGLVTLFTDFSLRSYMEESLVASFSRLGEQNTALTSATDEEGRMIRELISNPKKVVDEIFNWMPSVFFISIYLGLWLNIFLVLRNVKIWRQRRSYHFTLKDFIQFRASEYLVVPLILSLALALGGEYVLGDIGVVIGGNLLYCLGIFYFLQGLGIYLDFLTHIRLMGFMRTFLVILTVVLAFRILAILGVFDLWFNFRKYFKKDDNEGDIL